MAYAGTRRYCPCCGSHVRRFGRFGDRPRPEAQCPICGALERHRLATLFLRANPRLLQGLGDVLHVAPERPIARLLQRSAAGAYVSVDLSDESAMVRADLTRMPFRSHSFDGIFCSHVLEHVPDDHGALAELHRVLRPGGWALVQVPIKGDVTIEDPTVRSPELRRRLFGQADHVRVYGRDFGGRLAQARFEVGVHRPQRRLDRDAMLRCGLAAVEEVFVCTKP